MIAVAIYFTYASMAETKVDSKENLSNWHTFY